MQVNLAGYNVDTTVLRELEEKTGKRDDLTPEVLSAAYARISRDPRLEGTILVVSGSALLTHSRAAGIIVVDGAMFSHPMLGLLAMGTPR